jgi:hypothetical protein
MEGRIMDAFDKKLKERLHQRFLKEYGREPNSPWEKVEFYSKHADAVAREIGYKGAKDFLAAYNEAIEKGVSVDPEDVVLAREASKKTSH